MTILQDLNMSSTCSREDQSTTHSVRTYLLSVGRGKQTASSLIRAAFVWRGGQQCQQHEPPLPLCCARSVSIVYGEHYPCGRSAGHTGHSAAAADSPLGPSHLFMVIAGHREQRAF